VKRTNGALALLVALSVATPAAAADFPAPPPGAVVLARESGADAVALAVVPGRRLDLRVSVLGQQGPASGRVVGVTLRSAHGTRAARALACGPGCYRALLEPQGAPRTVTVRVGRSSVAFALPRVWPPPRADRTVRAADAAWRRLKTLAFSEHLASGPGAFADTRWRVVAPNRIAYQVRNGPAGIVIGPWRWDRLPGGRWQRSPQDPIVQPLPFWVGERDAHLLGRVRTRGVDALRITFFDPVSHAWFEVLLDPRSLLTLRMDMTTTAHFMHHVYGSFDAPIRIEPPGVR
jgi:hypothetical protein